MPRKWRAPGENMGVIDLRTISGDEIVIHFGGELRSIDAYTFANSLIAISDTIRAINNSIDPSRSIEIRVEAIGPGSFRAKLKKRFKGLPGLLGGVTFDLIIGLLGALLYDEILARENGLKITTTEDSYIIERGEDQIILPREVYVQLPNIRKNPEVQRNIRRTFETLENDPAIENFGLTPNLDDDKPLVSIPREEFVGFTERTALPSPENGRRTTRKTARLLVRKLWLDHSTKKWSFEWNGVPLSAPIKDERFLSQLESRAIMIGSGDALDVMLEFEQGYDESIGVWENDASSYRVVEVQEHLPKDRRQGHL